jgi:hypothetical protein
MLEREGQALLDRFHEWAKRFFCMDETTDPIGRMEKEILRCMVEAYVSLMRGDQIFSDSIFPESFFEGLLKEELYRTAF